VILVGGEGTRLRPLTSTVPKPVVPLVDRPFISFMLEWLRGHGVDDVIMSCGFLADGVRNVLGDGSGWASACASSRSPTRGHRRAR
jgi:mannose-1-phosphate guanylyltransferase